MDLSRRPTSKSTEDRDVYEGYDEEARSYFELLDTAFGEALRVIRPPELPKVFLCTKPSWIERLLQKLRKGR